jgi:subtilisin family serine protease
VDLAGPFWALSTVVNDMYQDETSGWCGTSMATPHVAGVAAIVRGEYPELTRDQVAQILFDSANDLGDSGWDEFFG